LKLKREKVTLPLLKKRNPSSITMLNSRVERTQKKKKMKYGDRSYWLIVEEYSS
jgi:hypothetical protein